MGLMWGTRQKLKFQWRTSMEYIGLIILLGLSTWQVSDLLTNQKGPMNILLKFRQFIGIKEFYYLDPGEQLEILEKLNLPAHFEPPEYYTETFWGSLVACILCLIIWVGALHSIVFFYFLGLHILFLVPVWMAICAVARVVNKICT